MIEAERFSKSYGEQLAVLDKYSQSGQKIAKAFC